MHHFESSQKRPACHFASCNAAFSSHSLHLGSSKLGIRGAQFALEIVSLALSVASSLAQLVVATSVLIGLVNAVLVHLRDRWQRNGGWYAEDTLKLND